MALRKIVKEGDEILTKVCRPVEKFDEKLWNLLDDMYETMQEADGVGLAAPQVGIRRRVAIVDIGDGVIELVNPEVIEKKGEQECVEGCLSFPGQYGRTKRPAYVKVKAQNRKGEFFEVEGEELLATACCHELDHLDGVVFKSHVTHMLTEDELQDLEEE